MPPNSTHGHTHRNSRRTSYNRDDGRLGLPGMERYPPNVARRTESDDHSARRYHPESVDPVPFDDPFGSTDNQFQSVHPVPSDDPFSPTGDHFQSVHPVPFDDPFSSTGNQFQQDGWLQVLADTTTRTENTTTSRSWRLNNASHSRHTQSAQGSYASVIYSPSQNIRSMQQQPTHQYQHVDRISPSAASNDFNPYNTPPRASHASASPVRRPTYPNAQAPGPRTNADTYAMRTFQVTPPQSPLYPAPYRGNLSAPQTGASASGYGYPTVQTAPRSNGFPSADNQQRAYSWNSLVTCSDMTTLNSCAPCMNRLGSTQSSYTTSSLLSTPTTTASIDSNRSTALPLSPTPASLLARNGLRAELRAQRMCYCDFPGCDTTCTRPEDLDRHKAVAHAQSRAHYHCPDITCSYWYSRRDKVTHHLRQGHADKDVTEADIIEVTDDDLILDGACPVDPACRWYRRREPYLSQ